MPSRHLVSKADTTSHKFVPDNITEATEANAGQALLKLDFFGLTSTSVGYAKAGDLLKYWNFFPHDEDTKTYGRIPIWGFATVAKSGIEGLEVGTRIFGFYPLANYHLLNFTLSTEEGPLKFAIETSPHRQDQPAVYNIYHIVAPDNVYENDMAALVAVLYPLFLAGYLFEAQTLKDGAAKDKTVVIVGASCRVSLCAAFQTKTKGGAAKLVGVTSENHKAFVTGTGLYNEVLSYDEVDKLSGPAIVLDFTGRHSALKKIQESIGGDKLDKTLVGGEAGWKVAGPPVELPYPITPFNAPALCAERIAEVGNMNFWLYFYGGFDEFLKAGIPGMNLLRLQGEEKVLEGYTRLIDGDLGPDSAVICKL